MLKTYVDLRRRLNSRADRLLVVVAQQGQALMSRLWPSDVRPCRGILQSPI